jgi:hypothetical protein
VFYVSRVSPHCWLTVYVPFLQRRNCNNISFVGCFALGNSHSRWHSPRPLSPSLSLVFILPFGTTKNIFKSAHRFWVSLSSLLFFPVALPLASYSPICLCVSLCLAAVGLVSVSFPNDYSLLSWMVSFLFTCKSLRSVSSILIVSWSIFSFPIGLLVRGITSQNIIHLLHTGN